MSYEKEPVSKHDTAPQPPVTKPGRFRFRGTALIAAALAGIGLPFSDMRDRDIYDDREDEIIIDEDDELRDD